MARNTLPAGEDAHAQTAMLPRCRLETKPTAKPLSPTESDAVIRALGDHRFPAVCVPRLGQDDIAARQQEGFRDSTHGG